MEDFDFNGEFYINKKFKFWCKRIPDKLEYIYCMYELIDYEKITYDENKYEFMRFNYYNQQYFISFNDIIAIYQNSKIIWEYNNYDKFKEFVNLYFKLDFRYRIEDNKHDEFYTINDISIHQLYKYKILNKNLGNEYYHIIKMLKIFYDNITINYDNIFTGIINNHFNLQFIYNDIQYMVMCNFHRDIIKIFEHDKSIFETYYINDERLDEFKTFIAKNFKRDFSKIKCAKFT